MTKLIINRVFAYIFIILSFAKVEFSLLFMHTSDLGESILHYIESAVHIFLLIFLVKQAIKNHIAQFFHEYFLEAIIMGGISSVALIYSCIIHEYTLDSSLIKLLPVILSIVVNIFLFTSFHHLHDHRVKIVLVSFIVLSIVLNVNSVIGNISAYANSQVELNVFVLTLISNSLSLFFNIFVLLTAISMKHVLKKDPSIVVDYVQIEENGKKEK